MTIAQVGINTTTPADGSLLDINSTEKGVFIPKVDITDLSTIAPITGVTGALAETAAEGLLVYNTNATSGPGYFYWDGTDWVAVGDGDGSDDWKLTGNTGTTAGTNFIGTTDNINFIVKTNDTERIRVVNNGQVTINDTSPFVGDRFTVTGTTDEYVINAYATGTSGVGVYAESSSYDAIVGDGSRFGILGFGAYGIYGSGEFRGVYGVVNNATGFGMVAKNDNATGVGLLVSGSNAPLNYLANTGATINGSTAVVGFSTSSSGTGISGTGNNSTTSRTLTDGSGIAGNGDTGVYGISTAASNGTGIIGVGGLTSAITTNNSGSGIAGSGLSTGVFGYAGNGDDVSANYGNAGAEFVLDGDNDPTTNATDAESNRARAILAGFNNVAANDDVGGSYPAADSYFGGYFSGGNENGGTQTYSYSALRYNTGADGTTGGSTTDFKVIGPGSNSTIIKDKKGTPRILFSPEAPEILFQDFGVGQLVNGTARITIDPILKESIFIDNKHPLKVYVTLEGECNGIYVTNKSADGFTVKELQRGTSNVSFSWQIVANRADTKDRNGRVVSKHVGVRLPIGPGPIGSEITKVESKTQTAKESKDESRDEIEISNKKTNNSILKSVLSENK